jgi:prepilin-type N-terminal cleavage/methylation domain-containing protein
MSRHPRLRRSRAGFTLAEMIISITLLAIIGAVAVPFYLRSLRSVANTSGQQDAGQSVAFALNFINHDLRLAGQGTVAGQPAIVQMSDSAVTFNANLVTADTSAATPGAYVDPNVPDSMGLAMLSTKQVTLPRSSTNYPDSTWWATLPSGTVPGVLGDAETISFWLAADTTTGHLPNVYVLWRRVNTGTPAIVARNIVFRAGIDPAPFQYYVSDQSHVNALDAVKTVVLSGSPTSYPFPLVWTHGTSTDTLLRNIMAVRVSLTAEYVNPITQKASYRTVNELVPLENGGMPAYAACPGPPRPPTIASTYVATHNTTSTTDSIQVLWDASPDETGGYGNVRYYMVYRKLDTATTWGTALYEQTAIGQSVDTIIDYPPLLTATPTLWYVYGVLAENCTPQTSTMAQTTAKLVPNP